MAIKQLTPEQISTMSLEEKDAWWLKNVYRGDMPQLTLRSALTGTFLGAFLALTNLYIGARTGWSLGVGITSVILSFALFKVLSKVRFTKEMTVLENNAMQSIATSAGYMNFPLFSSFAAYTMVTSQIIPMGRVFVWTLIFATLGVLFAFPMKKRFINDEQLPFPEGKAAGVVMDALHEADEKEGLFKAKLLVAAGFAGGFVEFIKHGVLMRLLFALNAIPGYWDDFLYGDGAIATWLKGRGMTPKIRGIELRELSVRWDTSIILMATGGLMGIRAGASMLFGGILNYWVLAPIMIEKGIIVPNPATGHYGFRQITIWALWGGVACMSTSSLYAFFSKPKVILDAFRGLGKRGAKKADVLADIELPLKVSIIGIPIVSIVMILLGHAWFGISYWLGAIAVPLVFVFSLIAVNATGLTSITPTGALGKLTQLTYGALAPKNIVTNIMTAGIAGEVSSNAANLLQDIKPGYMLGAKPRQQAVGHMLGAVSGLVLSIPVWYFVFIQGDPSRYGSDKIPVPGAIAWKAVAEVLMHGLHNLHPTARWAVAIGALVGILAEASKQITKGRFTFSAVGLGLAFVIGFQDIWSMFLGAFVFWMIERKSKAWEKKHEGAEPLPDEAAAKPESPPKKPWFTLAAANTETICAGVIAGGALTGILTACLDVFALPPYEAQEARLAAPALIREVEPNDAMTQANGPYSAGIPIRAAAVTGVGADWFVIQVSASGTLAVEASSAEKCGKIAAEIALFDGKGMAIARKGEAKGTCPKIEIPAAPGRYHVKIEARNEAGTPVDYTLKTSVKEGGEGK
jgi:uncharacterized oligopeptide transporter (OPT) family protein